MTRADETPPRDAAPITADDDTIRRALELADVPALLPALACATGDLSVLRDDLRIDPLAAMLVEPGGPPTPAEVAARELAFEVLRHFRDAGSPVAPPPGTDELRAMLDFAVAGGAPMDEYLDLFREELGVERADRRGPDWRLDDLAPGRAARVAVIGAGMSGLLAAYRLQQAGVPFVVFEKNADVGGTWLENSYPGCRVDVPNHFYSYSFDQRDDWPQLYSSQEVLLDYFRDFARRHDLLEHVRFGTEVTIAEWDEASGEWVLELRDPTGATDTLRATAVVSAVGQLNRPQLPDIAGRDTFAGPAFHSAEWRHDVELTGARVAVIGTGASAAQLIPVVAETADQLVVFQRTPPWLVPTPDYHEESGPDRLWLYRHVPTYAQWHRFLLFWRMAEAMLPLAMVDPAWEGTESVGPANEMLRWFLADYLTRQFADRPDLLEQVMPHYPPASKRVIRDDGIWARTLKRENVTLVTDGIVEITESGVRTADGTLHEVDVIVYGTGFLASRFLTPMRVVGCDGVELHDRWGPDARAYLGITIPGYPNLFLLYGPNTNIVVNGSIIFFSECGVRYLMGCLALLFAGGHRAVECRIDVHDTFNALVDEANAATAWGVADVPSWYRNETGRSAQNWPFTLLEYWRRTLAPDPAEYELR